MSLDIRLLEPADREALLALWVESWREVDAGIDFAARRDWFDGHLAETVRAGASCHVAVSMPDGEIAGFILLDTASGHLDQICAASRWKGRGVGPALLAMARRLSPAGLRLSVNIMNHRAIRFYEREGFIRTGEGINPRSLLPIAHYSWAPAISR
ncbi:MAG: GNAT family N-acetyltransferase [Beijerinckiaceae bacterium]|jgi:putative acetyltransferase|nr:GNAT family N-acetyltransferase [Beijerinckiaceae bacterium]